MINKFVLFLMLSLTGVVLLTSCGSNPEKNSTVETDATIAFATPPVPTTEATSSPEPAETQTPRPAIADTNGMDFREVLDTIPVRIYKRSDMETPWEEQKEAVNEAFENGLISERQLECILKDIDYRKLDKESTLDEIKTAVPLDVYDPSDSSVTLEEQREKVKNAFRNGRLSERQYAYADNDISNRYLEEINSGKREKVDLFNSSPNTPHDTYIPAHEGAPTTTMNPEFTGYEYADEEIDWSKYQNVVIE